MKTVLTTATLIASLASIGAQAAPINYLDTDFDATDVSGPVTLSTSSNFTGLLNTGDAAANTTIEENLTTVAVDVQPSGQHLRIDGNLGKHATIESAMTLLTDGVSEFDISFSYLLVGDINNNRGRILYSALGNFTDSVLLANYVITGSTLVNANDATQTVVSASTWYQENFTVTNSDVNFTDTAKIRFAQDLGGSQSSAFYMDDISITAVPEPGSLALLGLGGLLVASRRR